MMRPRLPLREAPGHLFPRVAALGRARTEPCRLVVNIPPRHSKSSLVGVLGPAWLWLHRPEAQCICITKADRNAKRDARKMRQVITSEPYPLVLHTVGLIVIAGGLGPPVLTALPGLWRRRTRPSLQLKFVVLTSAVLLVGGALLFAMNHRDDGDIGRLRGYIPRGGDFRWHPAPGFLRLARTGDLGGNVDESHRLQ